MQDMDASNAEPSNAALGGSTLAIVTSVIGRSTDTSQRRHIAELFGGNTATVCYSVQPGFSADKPVLHITRTPRGLAPRAELEFGKAWNTLRWRASGVPFGRVRRRVEAFLRENRCFAILAEFGHLGSSFAPIGTALGIPVFVYFRGFDASKRLGSPLRILSYKAALPRLAAHFAVSQSLLDNLAAKGVRHEHSHVIPSGVDTAHFLPAQKDPELLLAVGRLIPKKAPETTIAAFARLAADFPRHRLEFIGEGPLRGQCEALAASLGVQDRVTFHGVRDHDFVRARLAQAPIFLQHSMTDAAGNEEGLPIAIQEAMSSGAAVVSTRHAGIPEAIEDGLNGLLVAEGDLEGYGQAIRRLLADPADAARLAAAARRTAVARYDTTTLHRKLEGIIAEHCRRVRS